MRRGFHGRVGSGGVEGLGQVGLRSGDDDGDAGLSAVLDAIPGIGPKKRQTLLKHFKGLSKLKQASIKDIALLPGFNESQAGKVVAYLKSSDS